MFEITFQQQFFTVVFDGQRKANCFSPITWGFPCVGTGNLQPNTKDKPVFRLEELLEFRFHGDGPQFGLSRAFLSYVAQ
ncbi:MAG: hypothetical protein V7K69_23775 [Nostoc sp.]|uniref:hypothetical protein n=1 Tax=Nostoc sp. TaxID=1180 RepID=UPI002FF9CD91